MPWYKVILKKQDVYWINLTQDDSQWNAFVNTEIGHQISNTFKRRTTY